MADQNEQNDKTDWLGVMARSLAFLCLDKADLRGEKVGAQAEFLGRLGLHRRDAAKLLNTSEDSLRVLARLSKSKRQK
jgi:hypothetical protein